jgi:hypothetical protein
MNKLQVIFFISLLNLLESKKIKKSKKLEFIKTI